MTETLTPQWPATEADLPMYLTPSAFAQLRGCSTKSLERERVSGVGAPFVKLGRKIAYRKASVLAWLEKQEVASVAEAKRRERERLAAGRN